MSWHIRKAGAGAPVSGSWARMYSNAGAFGNKAQKRQAGGPAGRRQSMRRPVTPRGKGR